MNKTAFLSALQDALKRRDVNRNDLLEILEDYALMIDEAASRGESATFIARLGDPKSIARTLQKDLPKPASKDNRLIALSPFIALIIFFYVGFAWDAWHPGWLAFLLIPVTAILFESSQRPLEKLTALSVFIILIVFISFGNYLGWWHPMWALFFLIAGLGFLQHKAWLQRAFGMYTILAVGAYILYTLWVDPSHHFASLILLPILVMGLISGSIEIGFLNSSKNTLRSILGFLMLAVLLTLVYLYLGFEHGLWHPGWLIFLLIPVAGLLYGQWVVKEQVEPVAYTPFIALVIFFLWGEYGNAYAYSWLVFLIIPITAIAFNKD